MRHLDIFFGHFISDVQGVNSVTNMFLHGKDLFKDENISLDYIVHARGILNCKEQDDLYINKDGEHKHTNPSDNKWKKSISRLLRKSLLGEAIYFYFRHVIPAKITIEQIQSGKEFDYIIFQDAISAYYFFKKGFTAKKAIWISHSSGDIFSVFSKGFPRLKKCRSFYSWYRNFYYFTCNKVDYVVCLSPTAIKGLDFVPTEKKRFVFNGIANTEFKPIEHSGINLIVLGSVIPRKGQRYLVEAMELIKKETKKSVHLYIAGMGSDLDYCKKLASEKKVEEMITFCGQVNNVDDLLRKMDIMLLPSLEEGMPISIIEGMRQGVYTMVTHVGGCIDMINEEVGQFIERDASKIASAIDGVVCNAIISKERKIKIRNHFEENFSLKKFIHSYAMILNK